MVNEGVYIRATLHIRGMFRIRATLYFRIYATLHIRIRATLRIRSMFRIRATLRIRTTLHVRATLRDEFNSPSSFTGPMFLTHIQSQSTMKTESDDIIYYSAGGALRSLRLYRETYVLNVVPLF